MPGQRREGKKRMTDKKQGESSLDRAQILSEALPFMQRYDRRTVVVKYGGHAMGDEKLGAEFARDIVRSCWGFSVRDWPWFSV